MRDYERAMAEGWEGDRLQKAYDAMDAHEGWNFEARAREILGKLNLHNLERKVLLSGGEKRRVRPRTGLARGSRFFGPRRADQPPRLGHDRVVGAAFGLHGTTLFMVTHDRYFLENVCDRILELEDETLHSYHGNFSYFLAKCAERRANAQAVQERAHRHMKRELEWVRATPSARTTKSKSRWIGSRTSKPRLPNVFKKTLHISVVPERLGSKIVELHKVKKGTTRGPV